MSNFGIPYQGSKNGIAIDVIRQLPSGKRFVDLFGGGFAMSHCALLSGKYEQVLYNEFNPLLPPLLKKAIKGEYNYKVFKPKFITRKDFKELKEKDGYIKYIWSFSNGGDAYLFGTDIEKQKESIHNWVVFGIKDGFMKKYFYNIDDYIKTDNIKKRRLLFRQYVELLRKKSKISKEFARTQQLAQLERLQTLENLQQLERLERLAIVEGDYRKYEYKKGDIVYCDPPYENTAKYNNKTEFNHKEFYDWVASRPYQVYFSSYNNISDKRFRMVWACGKRTLMSGAVQIYKYECLYTNK